jgi:hypothetical protein
MTPYSRYCCFAMMAFIISAQAQCWLELSEFPANYILHTEEFLCRTLDKNPIPGNALKV